MVAAVLLLLFWRFSVRPSRMTTSANGITFPTVSGSNLARQELEFPRDFAGELNLLFVPFLREQQSVVNTWIPYAEMLESSTAGLIYYELPTIYQMSMVSRTFINEGMRAGIPDVVARERTITLYLDKKAFREALQLPDEDNIYALLLDRQGHILWRAEGSFTPEQGESLVAALRGA